MIVCRTSLIMGALTITIFLNDIWRGNTDSILIHIFLGLLTTILFYALCGYGYEIINWVSLGAIVLLLVISGLLAYNKMDCNICKEPVDSCCCKKKVYASSCKNPVVKTCDKPKPKPKCKISKYE